MVKGKNADKKGTNRIKSPTVSQRQRAAFEAALKKPILPQSLEAFRGIPRETRGDKEIRRAFAERILEENGVEAPTWYVTEVIEAQLSDYNSHADFEKLQAVVRNLINAYKFKYQLGG